MNDYIRAAAVPVMQAACVQSLPKASLNKFFALPFIDQMLQ
jgi:hypothetical protein